MYSLAKRLMFVACSVFAVGLITHSHPLMATVEVVIDHQTLIQSPAGLIKANRDELIHVIIKNTDLQCFEFNQTSIEKQTVAGPPVLPFKDQVEWNIIHDGVSRDYTFEAVARANAPASCKDRSAHKWTVSVTTDSWTLAFAGGFTADRLTDPVFSLESGQMSTSTGSQTGFFVRRDRKNQDSWTLGAAAMVHLYHSDPDRYRLFGANGINWVPVSFGLGINNSSTRYFLGTGFRFDTKFFLIAGVAIGTSSRLPNGIAENGFTTSSNALSTLGKQTGAAFFLALSYSFIDTGTSKLQAPFKDNAPAPSTSSTPGGH